MRTYFWMTLKWCSDKDFPLIDSRKTQTFQNHCYNQTCNYFPCRLLYLCGCMVVQYDQTFGVTAYFIRLVAQSKPTFSSWSHFTNIKSYALSPGNVYYTSFSSTQYTHLQTASYINIYKYREREEREETGTDRQRERERKRAKVRQRERAYIYIIYIYIYKTERGRERERERRERDREGERGSARERESERKRERKKETDSEREVEREVER